MSFLPTAIFFLTLQKKKKNVTCNTTNSVDGGVVYYIFKRGQAKKKDFWKVCMYVCTHQMGEVVKGDGTDNSNSSAEL